MGFLDPTKRKISQKVEEIQGNVNRDFSQIQNRVDKSLAEMKAWWKSLEVKLLKIFEINPEFKKEYNTPKEFIMGEQFEHFALELFPDSDYNLLALTNDFETNELRYVEESKYYDFRLRHRESIYDFAVECKYRSDLLDDKFKWAKEFQMNRYKEYEKIYCPNQYYVMMGLGRKPDNPQELYFIPLSHIQYVGLYPSFLINYRIKPLQMKFNGLRFYQ